MAGCSSQVFAETLTLAQFGDDLQETKDIISGIVLMLLTAGDSQL